MIQLFSVKTCPACNTVSQVTDTRVRKSGGLRRRRECPKCFRRWSTLEINIEEENVQPTEAMLHLMKANLGKIFTASSALIGILKKMEKTDDVTHTS